MFFIKLYSFLAYDIISKIFVICMASHIIFYYRAYMFIIKKSCFHYILNSDLFYEERVAYFQSTVHNAQLDSNEVAVWESSEVKGSRQQMSLSCDHNWNNETRQLVQMTVQYKMRARTTQHTLPRTQQLRPNLYKQVYNYSTLNILYLHFVFRKRIYFLPR